MPDAKIQENLEKVEAIQKIQMENIEAVLSNAKKLEVLKDKTEKLEKCARLFSQGAQKLKEQDGRQKRRLCFILLGMFFLGGLSALAGYGVFQIILSTIMGGILGEAVNRVRCLFPHCFQSPIVSIARFNDKESTSLFFKAEKSLVPREKARIHPLFDAHSKMPPKVSSKSDQSWFAKLRR